MSVKVSVCIPAYKRVALLRRALESILGQTYEDYEIILSDDTPGDSVKELLQEFEFNNKLKYFHNSQPLGSPANWNYAISKAEGEYIKILHCDDFFATHQSLTKYVELLDENPSSDFAFSSTKIITLPGYSEAIHVCNESKLEKIKQTPEYLFFKNLIGAPSATIYRRRAMLAFDEKLIWLVDVDFYIRFLKRNNYISHTLEPLICTLNGGDGQITQSVIDDKNIQIKEHIYLFDKIVDETKIKQKYFSFFFLLLLSKYGIKDIATLQSICTIDKRLIPFFDRVTADVRNRKLIKKLRVHFYNSSLNKYGFQLEPFGI